ncbi:MAG: energy transducer TonB [Tannerella sp.]|jgi:protein TonB|nr:energy transducer TonB [Tannerella sp.]
MEIKKSSKADLEKTKGTGLLMGLVVGLAILFVGFEYGQKELNISKDEGIADIIVEDDIEMTTQNEPPPPPPPPPPVQEIAEVLNIVEDDANIDQVDILSSEDTQTDAQVQTYVPPAAVEEEEEDEQHIFQVVEKMPDFPGGQAAMLSFIQKTLRYPVVAAENGIHGRVTCSFVVNKDGTIVDIEVLRGVDASLDKEAIRVISAMPKWQPGEQRGKPVRVKFTIPINFRLQ